MNCSISIFNSRPRSKISGGNPLLVIIPYTYINRPVGTPKQRQEHATKGTTNGSLGIII